MKTLLLLFILFFALAQASAQINSNKSLRVNDTEFIISGVLFGGGIASVAIGFLSKAGNAILQATVRDESANTAGNVFLIGGALSMVTGALLYLDARAKQKKRFALSIQSMNINTLYKGEITSSQVPSLSISIPLSK